MVFNFFCFFLILSVPEKLKNPIVEIPIIKGIDHRPSIMFCFFSENIYLKLIFIILFFEDFETFVIVSAILLPIKSPDASVVF